MTAKRSALYELECATAALTDAARHLQLAGRVLEGPYSMAAAIALSDTEYARTRVQRIATMTQAGGTE